MAKRAKVLEYSNLSMDISFIRDIQIHQKDIPRVLHSSGSSLFVLEAVYVHKNALGHQVVVNELICIKSTLDKAVSYIINDGFREGWETEIHPNFPFACYMVSLEYINDEDGPHETYCYNSDGERIMNISDPRPYRNVGYPD